MCDLSERVSWQVLPWDWPRVPTWWTARLALYLRARNAARQPEKRMTEDQLAVAPNAMSKPEAEAHLRSIGWLK